MQAGSAYLSEQDQDDVRDDNLDNNCPSSQNKMTSGISDEDGSIMLKLMVVVSVDTVTVMDIKFVNVHEDNSAAKNIKTDSGSKKSDDYMEKEASDVSHQKCSSPENLNPQRGPRSSLPGSEHDSVNKKGRQLDKGLTCVSLPFRAEHGDTHGTSNGIMSRESLNSSDPEYEGMLGKSQHEYCGYFNGMTPPNPTTVDEEGQTDLSSNTRKVDKEEDIKEPKAVKICHTALVDFLKELLKTISKEGHSSRDAHKMIVKKAAEKVLNALQPHQVPIDRVDKGSSFGIQAKALQGYGDNGPEDGRCKPVTGQHFFSWFSLQMNTEHELLSAAAAANSNSVVAVLDLMSFHSDDQPHF
ncbi:hypothetical protein MUK42_28638 [Musa troglodytarum]|uniref:Uncharacterized protein n=1 Tax=Musa troglodytarum TaxID=320322 RepID=A0A9E7G5D8_9LILI|nr:hypothetical protein MUK42_28638 [Musa troglodytarum]